MRPLKEMNLMLIGIVTRVCDEQYVKARSPMFLTDLGWPPNITRVTAARSSPGTRRVRYRWNLAKRGAANQRVGADLITIHAFAMEMNDLLHAQSVSPQSPLQLIALYLRNWIHLPPDARPPAGARRGEEREISTAVDVSASSPVQPRHGRTPFSSATISFRSIANHSNNFVEDRQRAEQPSQGQRKSAAFPSSAGDLKPSGSAPFPLDTLNASRMMGQR
jgi:hypothetical protein